MSFLKLMETQRLSKGDISLLAKIHTTTSGLRVLTYSKQVMEGYPKLNALRVMYSDPTVLDTASLLDTKGCEHGNFQYLGFFFLCQNADTMQLCFTSTMEKFQAQLDQGAMILSTPPNIFSHLKAYFAKFSTFMHLH